MKHHAITIGPIGKTLNSARATRELWAASYMFSYISKGIIEAIEVLNENSEEPYSSFLVPNISSGGILKQMLKADNNRLKGIGLFPNKIIFHSNKDIDLNGIIENVIRQFAKDVASKIDESSDKVSKYLLKYIQHYTLQMDVPEGQNASALINPYLGTMKLQRSFVAEDQDYLMEFFNRVTTSFLIQDAWNVKKDNNDKKAYESFETLLEIAFKEFEDEDEYKNIRKVRTANYENDAEWKQRKKEDDKLDEQLLDSLIRKYKNHPKTPLKQAHNYIAIVQSDGDNVGTITSELRGGDYNDFCKKLNKVNADAVKEIKDYGGMNIYAGGDDLLFFAPVVNGEDNVFRLLEKLNTAFNTAFESYEIGGRKPSLSFGVSITYYKFPLHEALQKSNDLLFKKAKTGDKNKFALAIQKHSGESFEGVYQMNSNAYQTFQKLMKYCLNNPTNKLSSIVFKIRENEAMFEAIGRDENKVKNFIDNSFDETVHLGEKKKYLDFIKALIPQVFKEAHVPPPPDEKAIDAANKAALKTIYGMIRTVSFLISTEIKL